jgi:hypothetical protein
MLLWEASWNVEMALGLDYLCELEPSYSLVSIQFLWLSKGKIMKEPYKTNILSFQQSYSLSPNLINTRFFLLFFLTSPTTFFQVPKLHKRFNCLGPKSQKQSLKALIISTYLHLFTLYPLHLLTIHGRYKHEIIQHLLCAKDDGTCSEWLLWEFSLRVLKLHSQGITV